MKKLLLLIAVAAQLALSSCGKQNDGIKISTPRTTVPDELVGRWAITSISGTTVYDIPEGATYNSNEVFLGYTISKDGTLQEHGYISTYQYGVATWTRWTGNGSAEINGNSLSFHRANGSYTSSQSSAKKTFGPNEVYPNKTFTYTAWEVGTDSRGQIALFLLDDEGSIHTYVKQ